MCNSNDFPSNQKLEKVSKFFLRSIKIDNKEMVEDIFLRIGLFFNDLQKDVNRQKASTELTIELTKIFDLYNVK
jgi:hypothetical protein